MDVKPRSPSMVWPANPEVIPEVLRMLRRSLMLIGLLFTRRRTRRNVLHLLYCIFVLLLISFFSVRFLIMFFSVKDRSLTNPFFMMVLAGLFWQGINFGNFLVFFIGSWTGSLDKIFTSLDSLSGRTGILRNDSIQKKLTWVCYAMGALSVFEWVCASSAIAVPIGSPDVLFMNTYPLPPFPSVPNVLLILSAFFAGINWVIPGFVNVIFMFCIRKVLSEHNDILRQILNTTPLDLVKLEDSRQRLLSIEDFISSYDSHLSCRLNVINYSCNIGVLLLELYSFLSMSSGKLDLGFTGPIIGLIVFWVIFSLLYMIVPTVAAIRMASPVDEMAATLRKVNTMNCSDGCAKESFTILHMYMASIEKGFFGVTVGHLFVVDKAAMLAIVGFMISYFILLVQFGMPPDCIPGPDFPQCLHICITHFNASSEY